MPSRGMMDFLRAALGGLLITSWLGTLYLLFFESLPPYHILFGFLLLGTAMGVLFVYFRSRHLTKEAPEAWDPAHGRGVALIFAAFYFILPFFILALVNANRTLSNLAFVSIAGASFGFFFLSSKIPPFIGMTPTRALPLHGFIMLISAVVTVIGILFVLSFDQASWLGFFVLMGLSASLSYYFGESFVS